ncbi:protein transport protein HofQ [Orbus hercynius]|uniref:Protein transport protein HofQ n=2 Tax=Orbus hercynius TaxID=593135 RepID=A0A495RHM3_9GAMM|nr:protein transport protein HofQ [Orbus hercynius]
MRFHQTPTSMILQSLADYRQMNLISDVAVDQIQTINLYHITWDKALALITQNAKLYYIIDNNFLTVGPLPNPSDELEQQRLQQKEQELSLPLVYLPLKIHHSDITSLLTIIKDQHVLSERGNIFIEQKTNVLVVYDIAKNVDKIKTLIEILDQPTPQVQISAHIVTMNNESASELGIKWGYTGSSSQFIDQLNTNLGASSPSTVVGFNLAKRSGHLLNLELSALEAENQLDIIASPMLMTADKHTASIKQGTEIPYEVTTGYNGSTSIEFKQAVLGLEVTPRLLKNGLMELTLYITQNSAGRSIKRSDDGETLAIDTQEIRTQVFVNSGETLVLGGIFQQTKHQDHRTVPGLSKLPIFGGLFRYKGSKLERRELVIFITPQIIQF